MKAIPKFDLEDIVRFLPEENLDEEYSLTGTIVKVCIFLHRWGCEGIQYDIYVNGDVHVDIPEELIVGYK